MPWRFPLGPALGVRSPRRRSASTPPTGEIRADIPPPHASTARRPWSGSARALVGGDSSVTCARPRPRRTLAASSNPGARDRNAAPEQRHVADSRVVGHAVDQSAPSPAPQIGKLGFRGIIEMTQRGADPIEVKVLAGEFRPGRRRADLTAQPLLRAASVEYARRASRIVGTGPGRREHPHADLVERPRQLANDNPRPGGGSISPRPRALAFSAEARSTDVEIAEPGVDEETPVLSPRCRALFHQPKADRDVSPKCHARPSCPPA